MPAETAIPLQEQKTKDKLSEMKQKGENWDEFLRRITETTNSLNATGTVYVDGQALNLTTT